MNYEEFNKLLIKYVACDGALASRCENCSLISDYFDLCEELTNLADKYYACEELTNLANKFHES